MPNKPKRPCRYRNCPKLVDNSSGYCEEHAKLISRHYDKFIRSPEHGKRYGYRWRKIRTGFLSGHPFCERCFMEGRYTMATEVHHIKPLSDGGTHGAENLMALCKRCHARIHSCNSPPTPLQNLCSQGCGDRPPLITQKKLKSNTYITP